MRAVVAIKWGDDAPDARAPGLYLDNPAAFRDDEVPTIATETDGEMTAIRIMRPGQLRPVISVQVRNAEISRSPYLELRDLP